ncbi:hypothetical protein GQ457_02G039750 [Hibiscus cannabinus]
MPLPSGLAVNWRDHFLNTVPKHLPVLLSGPCLPETNTQQLEDKWVNWLSQFEPGSVVFCSFGSQSELQKDEFQELVLGFESCGQPFLVALKPPQGCSTVEEALPEGFQKRVKGRGLIYGGWIMLIPENLDQILNTKLLVNELKVGVEVERGKNRQVSKESLSEAIKLVMDKENETTERLSVSDSKAEQKMSESDSSKLHIAMFPWVAYGHFIPFLHLSNKLAQKGHKVSFLLPKGVQQKLENMNLYPNSIQFFPLLLPQVDGLPPGAETASVVPMFQQKYLAFTVDQTRDQVEDILKALKPDVVFYDFWFWIPHLARQLGICPILYGVVCSMSFALIPKEVIGKLTVEDVLELPPDYPSSTVRFKAEEAPPLLSVAEDFGSGLSFLQRIRKTMTESDAIALRTCRETEGPFLDYVGKAFGKPVLLSGPCLPETKTEQLDDKWASWLSQFEPGSVVFCSFGSQSELQKDEFQELVLGFESCGLPFLIALKPPQGCLTIEEALPEGFQERVKGRGLIVLVPELPDQILNTRLMVNELRIGVEVERGKNRQVSKESLSEAIKLVMDNPVVCINRLMQLFDNGHAITPQNKFGLYPYRSAT